MTVDIAAAAVALEKALPDGPELLLVLPGTRVAANSTRCTESLSPLSWGLYSCHLACPRPNAPWSNK